MTHHLPDLRVQFTMTQPHHTHELVTVFIADEHCGLLILPRRLAWEVASRLIEPTPRISDVTAEVAGHVRWVIDEEFVDAVHEPTQHLKDLIWLIVGADEAERRALGRAYPAYVVAVAIATGEGGLAALRALHTATTRAAAG